MFLRLFIHLVIGQYLAGVAAGFRNQRCMGNKEFVSCGRPMKNKLFYVIVSIVLTITTTISIMNWFSINKTKIR